MPASKKSDRYFFVAFAFYYLLTMVPAFSFSTVQVISRDGGLRTIAIIHAVFGTVWLLLFVTQTVLIKAERRRLHMRLGQAGLPVMFGVFVTGILAIFRLHLPVEDLPHDLVASEVGLFTLGLVYAILGVAYRKSAPSHKRFMLLSMVLLSPAGMGRLLMMLGFEMSGPPLPFILIIFGIPFLSMIAYDILAYRKVFLATAIGIAMWVVTMALHPVWGFVVDVVRPLLV